MARTSTLLQLRTWARELSDTENDPNVTDSELTALANRHLTEVYDRLVDAGPPDYFAADTTVSVTAGVGVYPLGVSFRNLTDVFVHESTDERRSIAPMPTAARNRYKAPSQDGTVTIEFIPAAPVLVADSDTFDGISGWEELIANLMARDVIAKRESDPSVILNTIARLEGRISSRARSRDKGHPKRIVDTDDANYGPWWGWTRNSRIACYRLRGNNIEFFEPLWNLP